MFLVRIDKSTIRKNPNAGRTVFPVLGLFSRNVELKCRTLPEETGRLIFKIANFVEEQRCAIVLTKTSNGLIEMDIAVSGDVVSDDFAGGIGALILGNDDGVSTLEKLKFIESREVESVRILSPAPLYCFGFLPADVQCGGCGEEFDSAELETDSYDGELWSKAVCPKCGEWDCCEIVFEELTSEMIFGMLQVDKFPDKG